MKTFFASTIIYPQFYVYELAIQIAWTPWTAPSINSFNLVQSWASRHALVASYPVTFSAHFEKKCLQVSLELTGNTSGWLTRSIRRLDINSRYADHGRLWLASQSTKDSLLVHIFLLSSPNFKIYPCRDCESMPRGPKIPKHFRATNLTTSSVIFFGIKIGILSYTSNIEWGGGLIRADISPPGSMQRFYLQRPCCSMPVSRVAGLPLFPVCKNIRLTRAIFHIKEEYNM